MKKAILALIAITITSSAIASSGGLDRKGCHTERKTGIYHCHLR